MGVLKIINISLKRGKYKIDIKKSKSQVKAIKVKKNFFHHPREIAEALNKHFSTIGQKLANAMCPSGEEVLHG